MIDGVTVPQLLASVVAYYLVDKLGDAIVDGARTVARSLEGRSTGSPSEPILNAVRMALAAERAEAAARARLPIPPGKEEAHPAAADAPEEPLDIVPLDLEAKLAKESEEWARDQRRALLLEAAKEAGDWKRVRAAVEDGHL